MSLSHKQLRTGRVSLNAYFILTCTLAIAKDRILRCTRKGKSLVLCSTNAETDGWTESASMKWDFPDIRAYVRQEDSMEFNFLKSNLSWTPRKKFHLLLIYCIQYIRLWSWAAVATQCWENELYLCHRNSAGEM